MFRKLNWRAFLRHAVFMASPAALSAICINLFYVGFIRLMGEGRHIVYPASGIYGYNSYFEQFRFNMGATKTFLFETVLDTSVSMTRILAKIQSYIYDVYVYEGVFLICLLLLAWLISTMRLYRSRAQSSIFLIILTILPYLILLFSPLNPDNRLMVPIFAVSALPAGLFLAMLWREKKWGKMVVIVVFLMAIYNALPVYSVNSGFFPLANQLHQKKVRQVYTLDTRVHVNSFMEAYKIETHILRDWQDVAGLKEDDWLVLSWRRGFFNPPKQPVNVEFVKALNQKNVPTEWEGRFLPIQHAMDLHRRSWSPVMDWMLVKVLGENYKRSPFPVFLYKAGEVQAFMPSFSVE